MGKRLPTILGKAIDDVMRTLNEQVRSSVLPSFLPIRPDLTMDGWLIERGRPDHRLDRVRQAHGPPHG